MLRPYIDADLPELLAVWYRASLQAHPFLSSDFLEQERRHIAERWVPMAETTVFEKDGHVAGFLSLIDHEVGAIFVDPTHQRQGIGRALMDHARERHSVLELDVFEENRSGRAFYASYGFDAVGRRVDEASGQVMIRLRYRRERV